ncbi:MAG: hypothetical protein ACYS3S_02405 [Planctomycetota bacterium]|jgi:hypothetical protein
MNENTENRQIEDILGKAHLPEPSSELKERITVEARKAWNQTSPELPWQIPVRRLIVSAAAAVFIIWMANSYSDYALIRWQSGGPKIANQQRSDLDELTEIPYSPFARHMVSARRKPSITEASALHNYAERMLFILDEAQQNGASRPAAPAEGRSILLPTQSGFNSYS